MSLNDELVELNNVYQAQAEHLELVEAKLAVLEGVEGYCKMLETLLKDFSDFADRIPHAFLSPEMRTQREALQERTGELLEGKEKL